MSVKKTLKLLLLQSMIIWKVLKKDSRGSLNSTVFCGSYALNLVSVGGNKLNVIKHVREFCQMGGGEAKGFVEGRLPNEFGLFSSRDEA